MNARIHVGGHAEEVSDMGVGELLGMVDEVAGLPERGSPSGDGIGTAPVP